MNHLKLSLKQLRLNEELTITEKDFIKIKTEFETNFKFFPHSNYYLILIKYLEYHFLKIKLQTSSFSSSVKQLTIQFNSKNILNKKYLNKIKETQKNHLSVFLYAVERNYSKNNILFNQKLISLSLKKRNEKIQLMNEIKQNEFKNNEFNWEDTFYLNSLIEYFYVKAKLEYKTIEMELELIQFKMDEQQTDELLDERKKIEFINIKPLSNINNVVPTNNKNIKFSKDYLTRENIFTRKNKPTMFLDDYVEYFVGDITQKSTNDDKKNSYYFGELNNEMKDFNNLNKSSTSILDGGGEDTDNMIFSVNTRKNYEEENGNKNLKQRRIEDEFKDANYYFDGNSYRKA